MSDEVLLNGINSFILIFSAIILFFLSYNILKRENREYYETIFGMGLLIAGLSSLQAGFFRSFYALYTEGPLVETWKVSSYFYFTLMSISLTFLFTGGLAITRGKMAGKYGFIFLVAVIPISIAYWIIPEAVTIIPGLADTQMNITGVLLIFGTIALQIFIVAFIYLYLYYLTKNKGSLNMFIGLIVIFVAAAIGGLTDYIDDYGRFFDSLGYVGVLIGLVLFFNGFRGSET